MERSELVRSCVQESSVIPEGVDSCGKYEVVGRVMCGFVKA